MSGGSYNYLYCHVRGLEEQRADIVAMEHRLQASGYFAPARATREVLRMLEAAEQIAASLEDVWHAVEWVDSCDWGEHKIAEAVAKFEPWPPPAPAEVRKVSQTLTEDEVRSLRERGAIDDDGRTFGDKIAEYFERNA